MSDFPIYAEGYVAEVLEDGKIVVWPEDTPDKIAEMMSWHPSVRRRHYFAVDVVLQPAKRVEEL
jgi:hypothetical protein